jgi:hypothetical protein
VERILKKLNEAGARYLVIGGQAMLQEGMPRFTLDWDIFVPPSDTENFVRINNALADDLDMELEALDHRTGEGFVQTFQTGGGILQFHQAPPGLAKFDEVEKRAVLRNYCGVPVKYLCLNDLFASKSAVARDKDSDDLLFLKIKLEAASGKKK